MALTENSTHEWSQAEQNNSEINLVNFSVNFQLNIRPFQVTVKTKRGDGNGKKNKI